MTDGTAARKPSMSVAPKGQAPRVHLPASPWVMNLPPWSLPCCKAAVTPQGRCGRAGADPQSQGEFHFETYISLSCHNCPDVVQALNLMATLNPGITHTMIDGALFQDEVNERQIMAVPNVYLNGQPFSQGRISLEEIVAKLDTGAAERKAEELNEKAPTTCWSSVVARLAPPPPSMPLAKAFAPPSSPSVSVAR